MIIPLHDNNPRGQWPVVTYSLVAINALVWLSMLSLSPLRQQEIVLRHGFIPLRLAQLEHQQILVAPVGETDVALPPSRVEIYATLVTCMFLHASWLHIVGNLWFLWVFGNAVEDRLGHVTFLVFYLLTGFVASLCHWVNDPSSAIPVIGASGAVSGVLGAYAVTFPSARVRSLIFLVIVFLTVDLPAMLVLGFWFFGQVLEAAAAVDVGFDGDVAWWAHIGGFVVGMTVMPWLDREHQETEESPGSWLVPLGWPF